MKPRGGENRNWGDLKRLVGPAFLKPIEQPKIWTFSYLNFHVAKTTRLKHHWYFFWAAYPVHKMQLYIHMNTLWCLWPTIHSLHSVVNYIKHKTCRNKNPTAIGGERDIKRFYSLINALHCVEKMLTISLFTSAVYLKTRFTPCSLISAVLRNKHNLA